MVTGRLILKKQTWTIIQGNRLGRTTDAALAGSGLPPKFGKTGFLPTADPRPFRSLSSIRSQPQVLNIAFLSYNR